MHKQPRFSSALAKQLFVGKIFTNDDRGQFVIVKGTSSEFPLFMRRAAPTRKRDYTTETDKELLIVAERFNHEMN